MAQLSFLHACKNSLKKWCNFWNAHILPECMAVSLTSSENQITTLIRRNQICQVIIPKVVYPENLAIAVLVSRPVLGAFGEPVPLKDRRAIRFRPNKINLLLFLTIKTCTYKKEHEGIQLKITILVIADCSEIKS